MPLSGTFDVLDFAEVLRLLGRQQVTGRLHVRARHYGANLFFEEGALVGADQSEHQAAAAAGDVRGRLEEICFELLDADRGTFEFQPGRPSAFHGGQRLKVDPVIARARKRLEEWQELQEAIPSLDAQPRLADDLNTAEVTIDQERWRVLTVIDGRRNLRAIGRTLGLSDFDVCRVVKGLLDDGVVELDARAAAVASAARESIPPVAVALDPELAVVEPPADDEKVTEVTTADDVDPAHPVDAASGEPASGESAGEATADDGSTPKRRVVRIRSRKPAG